MSPSLQDTAGRLGRGPPESLVAPTAGAADRFDGSAERLLLAASRKR